MTEQPNDPGTEPILGERYRILTGQPLPLYDNATATAVRAEDQRAKTRPLIALICKPGLVPRLDIIPQLSLLTRLPMIMPVEAGPATWPASGGRRYVVAYEKVPPVRLQNSLNGTFKPLREDQIFHNVILPILPALKELSNRSIRHRAIRADNIYYTDETKQSALLGECVSGPPGMAQPALYEPVDAAMANVAGRGPGLISDDLYALGVVIAVLLTGGNPAKGMSDNELIATKIRAGSYAALIQDLRPSLHMIEPLRGLLCDDAKERWTAHDLELWAGGRQLSPKQPMLPVKANRTITFAEKEYLTRASLSHAMGCQWSRAAELMASGELVNWLKRSFGDEESASAIQSLATNSGAGSSGQDRVTSGALVVLDSTHPLRYRDISARIDGFATLLAVNYRDEGFRKSFVEMMNAKLPQLYLQSVGGRGPDLVPLIKMFDMFNYFLERPKIGNGLERALYEANRGWPCQSALIAEDYVCDLDDLLPAMERTVRRGAAREQPIDRHIAAFCAARAKSLAEIVSRHLGMNRGEATELLGVLHVYAEVHRITGASRRYPAVTAWLAAMMTPVVERYHNRAERERLTKAVERIGGQGSPTALLEVLDDMEGQNADESRFAAARRQYAQLENSINWLSEGGLAAPERVRAKGRQGATFVSAMIAGLTIVVMSIVFVA